MMNNAFTYDFTCEIMSQLHYKAWGIYHILFKNDANGIKNKATLLQ